MKKNRKAPARVLAILALIGAVVAIGLVIGAATGDDGSPGNGAANTQATQPKKSKPARETPRFYVVKSGDNLTTIAAETGVSVAVIERLNPDVDALTLVEGEKLKLR